MCRREEKKPESRMGTGALLCLFILVFVEIAEAQRVAIRRRPPKKRPTNRPKSAINVKEGGEDDLHGGLSPEEAESEVSRDGCRAPEVVVNGSGSSPGADLWATVHEVHFVGMVGRKGQRRECKIKCLNGVWVGPICTDAGGNPVKRVLRRCTLRVPSSSGVVASLEDGRALPADADVDVPHDASVGFRCAQLPGLSKFQGNATLLCDDGSWSAELPRCQPTSMNDNFSVDAPPTILYHVVSGDAGLAENGSLVVFPGSIINFDCLFQRTSGKPQWIWTPTHRQYPSAWALGTEEQKWKYRLSIYYAKDYDSGSYTCVTPHDVTNDIDIVVKDVQCPALRSVDHNRVMAVEGNRMHSKARFACVEGFRLVGPEEITCRASGLWSEDAPHCEVRRCPSLMLPSRHLVASTRNRTYGTKVVFSCGTGFKLAGAPFLTCLPSAQWSGDTPTCDPVTCKRPQAPVHGRVLDSGRFLAGDFVQYTCAAGHVVVGESVSVCTDHGVWSQPAPTCKAACEFPGEPSHGQVIPTKFHYAIGEVVVVGCRPGFRVLGLQQLRCTASSHWSSPLPHCRPYQPQPPAA